MTTSLVSIRIIYLIVFASADAKVQLLSCSVTTLLITTKKFSHNLDILLLLLLMTMFLVWVFFSFSVNFFQSTFAPVCLSYNVKVDCSHTRLHQSIKVSSIFFLSTGENGGGTPPPSQTPPVPNTSPHPTDNTSKDAFYV